MSGHLDGPPPGPPDPPYIPGDLGAPSAEEFARRRASSEPRPENPYPNDTDSAYHHDRHVAWNEGFASRQPEIDRLEAELADWKAKPIPDWQFAARVEDQLAGATADNQRLRAERDAVITAGQKLADAAHKADEDLILIADETEDLGDDIDSVRAGLKEAQFAWRSVAAGINPEGDTTP